MSEMDIEQRIAVVCVGNKLLLDEGIGPAVYDELLRAYDFPSQVDLFDVGCMSLEMISYVDEYDTILTVDAVDGTGEEPGTIFRYRPEDMQRHSGAMQSLHDLKLIDLFDAATLLGYSAKGICVGMQVENMSPAEVTIGLTPCVYEALPKLVDLVLAELTRAGATIYIKGTDREVGPEYAHTYERQP